MEGLKGLSLEPVLMWTGHKSKGLNKPLSRQIKRFWQGYCSFYVCSEKTKTKTKTKAKAKAQGERAMKWIEQWHVKSSSGSKVYTVSRADDGTWGCSCLGWTRGRNECKHIRAIKAAGNPGTTVTGIEPAPGEEEEERPGAETKDRDGMREESYFEQIARQAPWRFKPQE